MKRVLITGGTRGIGKSLVEAFANSGYQVAFCYENSTVEAEELFQKFKCKTDILPIRCDLGDPVSISKLATLVDEKFGGVDVLINNAGVSSYSLFQDVSVDEYDRVMNVNFKSMYFLTQRFVAAMIRNRSGKIINLSSVWGQTGASCEVLYSASKAAVIGFTKALAKELAPSGIMVNCIAPGVVDTDMMSKFSDDEKMEICNEIPTQRFATTDEIAKIALFLANSDLPSLTGQIIPVNGGFYC